jgi:hypothetical protein
MRIWLLLLMFSKSVYLCGERWNKTEILKLTLINRLELLKLALIVLTYRIGELISPLCAFLVTDLRSSESESRLVPA